MIRHTFDSRDTSSCLLASQLFLSYAGKPYGLTDMELQELFFMVLKSMYIRRYFHAKTYTKAEDVKITAGIIYTVSINDKGKREYCLIKDDKNIGIREIFDEIINTIDVWAPYYDMIKNMDLLYVKPQLVKDNLIEDRFRVYTMKDLFTYVSAFYQGYNMLTNNIKFGGISYNLSQSIDVLMKVYIDSHLNKETPDTTIDAALIFDHTFETKSTLISSKDLSEAVKWIRHHETDDFMDIKIKTYSYDHIDSIPTGIMVIKRGEFYNDTLNIIIHDNLFNIKYRVKLSQVKFLEKVKNVLLRA